MRISVTVSALIWWAVAVTADMEEEDTEFTNTWVAEIHGGERIARRVARDHGYVYEGPVSASTPTTVPRLIRNMPVEVTIETKSEEHNNKKRTCLFMLNFE